MPDALRATAAALLLAAGSSATGAADSVPPDAAALPPVLRLDDALRRFRERGLDLLVADAAVRSAEGDPGSPPPSRTRSSPAATAARTASAPA